MCVGDSRTEDAIARLNTNGKLAKVGTNAALVFKKFRRDINIIFPLLS